ncbi:hypothetical protein GUJ93_ZPchr0010g9937 [Zizania palustris]|uniref:F-box domain-containing protein n=1 Tax=Zizania palustris TaxID=103762 RepID=A0A8J5WBK9_ZIZPA|nr:hypothetical protein GUJ93_ZPchr0010g9937 [Zizania palustris]
MAPPHRSAVDTEGEFRARLAKRARVALGDDVAVGDDRDHINDLLDAVLLSILSFIPFRDVSHTAVLSLRWHHLFDQSLLELNACQPFPSEEGCDYEWGYGYEVSVEGLKVSSDPWNNISCQSFQPMLNYTGNQLHRPVQTCINFEDEPYSGGDCVTVKGRLQWNDIFSEQLFNGGLSMEGGSVYVFYSVKADANSGLGLSLNLSSGNKGNSSILIAEDTATFTRKEQQCKYGSYIKADKEDRHDQVDKKWTVYKAIVQFSPGFTLTGINIVCTMKTTGITDTGIDEQDGSSEAGEMDHCVTMHH